MARGSAGSSSRSGGGRTEVEAKYVVPDERTFARLLRSTRIGSGVLQARGEEDVADMYLDTTDRALVRGGWACRVREVAGGAAWTVSLKELGRVQGAVHRRLEHEVVVARGAIPAEWPTGAVRDRVLELAAGAPLGMLLTLRQHRVLHDVVLDGRNVAVRFLDRGTIEASGRQTTFLEMELELAAGGTPRDLRTLDQGLKRYGLRPEPRSKFERGLALLDAGTPAAAARRPRGGGLKSPGVAASDTMAEAGRKILRFHFERMVAEEPGVREGADPEALHDMRVATRRQRTALRIVTPWFRRRAIAPVRRGLRGLGRRLGAVRDVDVLLASAREHRGALGPAAAADFAPLLDAWTARRDEVRALLLVHLDAPAYAEFCDRYTAFLATSGAGVRLQADETPRPQVVAHVLPAEMWRYYGAVRAFASALAAAPVSTLHELRIASKRLRYLLEFFREVLDPCVEEAIAACVALQDHLGALHDADVAARHTRAYLAGTAAAGRPAAMEAALRYLQRQETRVAELRRDIAGPWERVQDPSIRAALARAAAAL